MKPYALAFVATAALTACGSSSTATPDLGSMSPSGSSSATPSTSPTAPITITTDLASTAFPVLVETGGTPTGFTWAGVAKPSGTGKTEVKVLKEGSGAVVKDTDTVTVNYLGEVYQGTQPFDASYPTAVQFSLGGVVAGFKDGIAGQKVGSQILIKIPPADGYPDGTPDGSIPPGATLYFVVDIVSVG